MEYVAYSGPCLAVEWYFYTNGKIIITNAFRKKQQKLPRTEKEKAIKARESYVKRLGKGEYYE